MTQQEYISLVNQANKASYDYYVLSNPSITDAAFDVFISQIEQCEQQHPEWTLPDSPTQKVGSDLSDNGRRTIAHRTPMRSCQKAKTRDAVLTWLNNTISKIGHDNFQVSIEYKYDGISCSLVYQDGQLISASTRGNGLQGQDITAHAGLISGIPQQLPALIGLKLGRIEIYGEIVCPKANLNKISRLYTDCRTAASSLCNMEVATPDCAMLAFVPWKVDAPCFSANGSHFESMMFAVHSLGFNAECPACFDASYIDGIIEHISLCDDRENRNSIPYPIDGLVIKVDDKNLADSLGSTVHHPHGNIAYKFSPETVITTCTRIEITVGKTGRRTPVAYFNSVTIMGREVSRASLYSEATVAKLGIEEGSIIEVGLSNDITPKVFRVIDNAENHQNNPCVALIPDPESETTDEFEEEVTLHVIPNMVSSESAQLEPAVEENMSPATSTTVPTEEDDEEEPEQTGMVTKLATLFFSVVLIFFLLPISLALAAFGIPVFNNSFINSSIH